MSTVPLAAVLLGAVLPSIFAMDNGLAKLPPMVSYRGFLWAYKGVIRLGCMRDDEMVVLCFRVSKRAAGARCNIDCSTH